MTSLPWFAASAAVLALAQSREPECEARYQVARRLYFEGRFEGAREHFGAARECVRQKDGRDDVLIRSYEGLCLQYQDRFDEALQAFREAASQYEAGVRGEHGGALPLRENTLADALNNVGWALHLQGEYAAARVELLRALSFAGTDEASRRGYVWVEGRIRTNLAVVAAAQGEMSSAYRALREIADTSSGDAMNRTRALENLGRLEESWGDVDAALGWYENALASGDTALSAPTPDPYNRAYLVGVLSRLGMLYEQRGRARPATAALDRALATARQLGTRHLVALVLLDRGRMARTAGDLPSARAAHEEALALARTGDLALVEAQSLAELGWDALAAGEAGSAFERFERALDTTAVRDAPEIAGGVHAGIARALERLGRFAEAAAADDMAIAALESTRVEALSEARRLGFWRVRQAEFRSAITLLHRLSAEQATSRVAEHAFELAEKSRARTLLELIGGPGDPPTRSADPQSLSELRVVAAVQKRLFEDALSDEERANLSRELTLRELRLLDLEQRERLARPDSPSHSAWTVERLRSQLVADDAGVVAFLLDEPHSWVWLLTREDCRMAALPGRSAIESVAREWRRMVSAPEGDGPPARARARRLYQTLLGELEPGISRLRSLLVVPDGALHLVPFEGLEDSRGRLLLERHVVSYAPSASVAAALRARRVRRPHRPLRLLAYADPPPSTLGPLPTAATEARSITRLYPAGAVDVRQGRRASESWLKHAPLEGYDALHFATHGLYDDAAPGRSALLLAADMGEDGLLQVREIAALSLRASLVALSACETGLGEMVTGEGVLGLARAFLHAGADSVAMTLWRVPDVATSELMQAFYRRLRSGEPAADALRAAKLELRAARPRRSAYHWAGVVLSGYATSPLASVPVAADGAH